jgi:hypothetical protein
MKSTELRIGNLVYITDSSTQLFFKEVTEINIYNLMYLSGECKEPIEFEIEPIPLTEEWLLKMGFDKAINGWFCSKEYLWLRQNKLNNQWFAGVNGIGDIDCKRIDYVHCLQNLYFALTGEELTFSTPKTNSQTQAPEY